MKRAVLFLTILAFCFTSCENLLHDVLGTGKSAVGPEKKIPEKTSPEKPAKDIKYTITSDNKTHTNSIEFSFDGDIKELKAKDIHITNKSGSVKKGKLSGSGALWSLEVTASTPGKIEVKIVKPGIEGKKKKMDIYHKHIIFPEKCDKCGKEHDNCDCEEKCCDECAGYECPYCKDQGCKECTEYDCPYCEDAGCDACTEYNCYYCKDTGCDACTEYNCYYCKDAGCDACRAY